MKDELLSQEGKNSGNARVVPERQQQEKVREGDDRKSRRVTFALHEMDRTGAYDQSASELDVNGVA